MSRLTAATMALVLVVSALLAAPAAVAQQTETPTPAESGTDSPSENATDANASVEPGAQLAGAVAVQEAEIDGEVRSRAYGIRVAKANTDDARAGVVADQVTDVEQRLDELEQRRTELNQARENGSMSEGEYRARVATLHAESRSVERLAGQANATASGLPASTLEANGVDVTVIRSLSERANELSGPEVAAIAEQIAGPDAGREMRPDRAGDSARDGDRPDARNGTDRGADGRDGGSAATATMTPAPENTTTAGNETRGDDGSASDRSDDR